MNKSLTNLEQYEGEKMMTEFYFLGELTQVKCAQLVVVSVEILWTAEHTF